MSNEEQTTEAPAEGQQGLLSTVQEAPADSAASEEYVAPEETGEVPEVASPVRPEGLQDQFWNEEKGVDTDGLAKAYNELRGKMDRGEHKQPKDGYVSENFQTNFGEIEAEDIDLDGFQEIAKEHGLSQAAYDDILKHIGTQFDVAVEDATYNHQEQTTALGDGDFEKGQERVDKIDRWIAQQAQTGILNISEANAIAQALTSVEAVKALGKIIPQTYEGGVAPVSIQGDGTTGMTKGDLDAAVSDPRYGVDMAFTSKVDNDYMKAETKRQAYNQSQSLF